MKQLQPQRYRVALATIVTLLGLATLGLTSTSASAAPNDPIGFSSYLISPMPTLDPLVPPGHLVTMRGTYKNTTDAFISDLTLDLATFGPITTRTQLGELLIEPNNFDNLAVTTTKTSARLRN